MERNGEEMVRNSWVDAIINNNGPDETIQYPNDYCQSKGSVLISQCPILIDFILVRPIPKEIFM